MSGLSEIETLKRSERRRAQAEAQEQLRNARDNPLGLSAAQALVDYKIRQGLDPDLPLTQKLSAN